jgi:hypothetical protein
MNERIILHPMYDEMERNIKQKTRNSRFGVISAVSHLRRHNGSTIRPKIL